VPRELMEVEFSNLTVTVPNVENGKEAYDKLCEVLGQAGFEWTTSLFRELPRGLNSDDAPIRDTVELFPDDEDEEN
jgi:hypothetical protein